MLKFCFAALLTLFSALPLAAEINPATVRVVASPPEVLSFPATATLQSVGLKDGVLYLRSTGTENWPGKDIGNGTLQNATLWFFAKIDGQWVATGMERLRPGQANGTKPASNPSDWVGQLLSDPNNPNRWGPLQNYDPYVGEIVGFMIAAGSSRADNWYPVRERTQILEVVWPQNPGENPLRVADGGTDPIPPDPPQPPVEPPDNTEILQRLSTLETKTELLSLQLDALAVESRGRIGDLEASVTRIDGYLATRPIPVHCRSSVFGIPVSCALIFE